MAVFKSFDFFLDIFLHIKGHVHFCILPGGTLLMQEENLGFSMFSELWLVFFLYMAPSDRSPDTVPFSLLV